MSDQDATSASQTQLRSVPGGFLQVYAEAPLPTRFGMMRAIVLRENATGLEHVAMVSGDVAGRDGVLVRVHSECMTSEVFGSLKCDCKAQLDSAMEAICREGCGAVVYLRQEGRGIGLGNKVRAYALQSQGMDTFQANRALGFAEDLRRYEVAAEALKVLGVGTIDLITNNPLKVSSLKEAGVSIRRRVPSLATVTRYNRAYLLAKARQSGHLISLPERDGEMDVSVDEGFRG